MRRIAALAEVCGAILAPHCPLRPISPAASLQVAFAAPNVLVQEQRVRVHCNGGTEFDEDAVRTADQTGHAWRSPVWRHDDGSLAEW